MRLGAIDFRLRRETSLHQAPLTVVFDARVIGLDLSLREVGLALLDLGLERSGIELREHLALLHGAVEVGVEAGDDAGDLTADLDGRDRGKRPRGRDGHGHVAAVGLLALVLLVFLSAAFAGQKSGGEEQCCSDASGVHVISRGQSAERRGQR